VLRSATASGGTSASWWNVTGRGEPANPSDSGRLVPVWCVCGSRGVGWCGCLPASQSVSLSVRMLACVRTCGHVHACVQVCLHACVRVRACASVCKVPLLNLVCTRASHVPCYTARDTWRGWVWCSWREARLRPPLSPLHRDWAHVCTGTGAPSTSAPDLGSALRVCARTGLTRPTSAPELGVCCSQREA
jgi:hypothetical protein